MLQDLHKAITAIIMVELCAAWGVILQIIGGLTNCVTLPNCQGCKSTSSGHLDPLKKGAKFPPPYQNEFDQNLSMIWLSYTALLLSLFPQDVSHNFPVKIIRLILSGLKID